MSNKHDTPDLTSSPDSTPDKSEEFSSGQIEAIEQLGRDLLDEQTTAAEVLGINPEYIDSMEKCAHLLYSHGRFEQAATLLDAIIQLDDERYYPFLLLGDIAIKRGHFKEATACLHRAEELSDGSSLVDARLGEALLRLEEYPAGLSYLNRAVETADDPEADYIKRAGLLIYVVGEMMSGDAIDELELPEANLGVG